MNSKLVALALLGVTATGVVLYPAHQNAGAANSAPPDPGAVLSSDRPKVEVVFVLDTTGSMGGLIQAAKEKIWSIATTMAQAQPAPEIRIGLVAYRDRGDSYITRVVDLSTDLDSLYATLMEFQAQGGGDGPESVNRALYDAVHNISWSHDNTAYRVMFLVGDAPPHMDYQDDVRYPVTLAAARQRGIFVNAVQCGSGSDTARAWQQIAQLGQGEYLQVEQGGGGVAIATPFDEKLATLSAQLDDTRLYYGSDVEKQRQQRKLEATEKLHAASSVTSRARRATFNASASGAANLIGDGELVEDVVSGRVDLSSIEREALPASLQAMSPRERRALIEETAGQRDALKDEIRQLAEQRATYLKQKVEEAGGAPESLDKKIYSAVRAQAAEKGLQYEAGGPSY
jgi:Mg-chelatase subunit ChlD